MNNLRLHGIAVYNPGLWSREELKAYFVARQELLEQILAALRQQETDAPCQHRLLLGLRGMGKSTLLRRIALAVEEDAELNQHWLPLTFPEEQYNISTAADLWRNCLDAFCDLIEEREGKAQAEALDEAMHELADDEVFSRLLAEADARNRRLLLLIDNIDLILERLKKEEPELRRVLQHEPRLFLIGASAQQEVKADFFSATDKLAGLSLAEMQAMLTRLVEQELAQKKTPESSSAEHPVLMLLRDDPARIKTLHTLTGGNPRTVALLYNVLARGLDGDVRSDLEGLLDLVTPLYKARFEELPQQAQQLVDGLAVNWDPMTARQLADTLKWDINITSSQLNRLQQQGHVEKVEPAKGGRAAFQIGERFFNIWYLMRASRRVRRKLIWLVHFLRMFFSAAELQSHAKKLLREKKSDIRRAEYKLALARVVEDRQLKKKLNYDGLFCLLENEKDWKKVEAMLDLEGEDAELCPMLNDIKSENLYRLIEKNEDINISIDEFFRLVDILFYKRNFYISCIHISTLVANNQWQEAEPHIRALLAKGDDDFFDKIWQDMLTLFKESIRTGKAKEALALLDESPLAERWRPLREALSAAAEGTSRYLNGVAPEVREPALAILKDIAPDVLPSP